MGADVRFWFDPVCPFAWLTSRWLRMVVEQRDYSVEWRLVSLRLLNAGVDYDARFPPEYEGGHNSGMWLLRVAHRTREEHGAPALAPLYAALGGRIHDEAVAFRPSGRTPDAGLLRELLLPALEEAGLPAQLAEALEDEGRDAAVRAETEEALSLTGRDVGTPIVQFRPPDGVAFFGPVISRLPAHEDAVALWDHVVGLASFPGFSELKRSLRERPQLRSMGVERGATGVEEDWHGGSRRQHT